MLYPFNPEFNTRHVEAELDALPLIWSNEKVAHHLFLQTSVTVNYGFAGIWAPLLKVLWSENRDGVVHNDGQSISWGWDTDTRHHQGDPGSTLRVHIKTLTVDIGGKKFMAGLRPHHDSGDHKFEVRADDRRTAFMTLLFMDQMLD